MDYLEIIHIAVVLGNADSLVYDITYGRKQFNSWFYYAFEKEIVIRKGAECKIEIHPKQGAKYCKIGENQLKESLGAAKCSAKKGNFTFPGGWGKFEPQNYILKSIHLQPIN